MLVKKIKDLLKPLIHPETNIALITPERMANNPQAIKITVVTQPRPLK